MKNLLTLFFVIFFVGCGYSPEDEGIESGMDLTDPTIAEVTAIVSPIKDSTPDYTFSSTENGTTTYGGSCSSNSTVISSGNNTITFNNLSDATYSNCTITVADWALNESNVLDVSTFTVDVFDPVARVTSATITISENAVVKSSETGTAYMVNTSVSVDNVTHITSASDNRWNSVTIESANTNTNMPAVGLLAGTYKVYAVDNATNFSNASTNSVIVSAPTPTITADNVTTSENIIVSSEETGTVYLVNTGVSVSSVSNITSASDNSWNSVSISSANTNTNLSAAGLTAGTYVAYAIDNVSNLSSATTDNVTLVVDKALNLDGTNDNASANGAVSEIDNSDNLPISVSAWVYPEDASSDQIVFGFFKNSPFFEGPSVWYGDIDSKFGYFDNVSGDSVASSTSAINNWHHVVLTIGNNGSGALYVNGSSLATFSGVYNSGGLDMFSIGVDYDNSSNSAGSPANYFDGKVDEIALWNDKLTSAEVTAIYNSGKMFRVSSNSGNYQSSANLQAYYRFNEGSGTTFQDNSSNTNSGSITGGTWTDGFISQ